MVQFTNKNVACKLNKKDVTWHFGWPHYSPYNIWWHCPVLPKVFRIVKKLFLVLLSFFLVVFNFKLEPESFTLLVPSVSLYTLFTVSLSLFDFSGLIYFLLSLLFPFLSVLSLPLLTMMFVFYCFYSPSGRTYLSDTLCLVTSFLKNCAQKKRF